MNISKGKVLVAMLATLMMAVAAVPLVGGIPTTGDQVTRDTLDPSALYGLKFDYRPYSNAGQWNLFPNLWQPTGLGGAWAGEMVVTVTGLGSPDSDPSRLGEKYTTFCLDFYMPIAGGDVLAIDSDLDNILGPEEAMIVNYILVNFVPQDDLDGAAIQCAIWYYTTEKYGTYDDVVAALPIAGTRTFDDIKYQFMTDPDPVDPVVDMYDAKINTVSYPAYAADPSELRDAAFDIINAVEAAKPDLSYPYSISVTPDTQTVNVGDQATLTITVLDQHGEPFEGASVCVKWMYDSEGLWHEFPDWATTDVNGEISVLADSAIEDTLTFIACIRGGEAIWIFDPQVPMEIQSLVVGSCPCDEATVVWEQRCYYPDGHTPGFWKNNARKWLEFNSGESKKYVGYQVWYEDYEDYLDAITGMYGGDFPWLSFTGTTEQKLQKAYDILSYGGSDPLRKAQKHMLSALLTVFWYDDQMEDGTAWYLDGCVNVCGEDMNIADAIEAMLSAYDSGDYELAHEIAGALNEQGDS
jgi:hypothetical protein